MKNKKPIIVKKKRRKKKPLMASSGKSASKNNKRIRKIVKPDTIFETISKTYRRNRINLTSVFSSLSYFKLFRLAAVFVFVLFILGFLYSFHLKSRLYETIQNRRMLFSSVIYGRTVELYIGSDIKKLHILRRLENLEYKRVAGEPQIPGEFSVSDSALMLFSRKTRAINGAIQPEKLFHIALDDWLVTKITDAKYGNSLSSIVIEPEILSLYGQRTMRASKNLTLQDFPVSLTNAVLSVEDERFFKHFGIDPISVIRASFVNISKGGIKQGGSTITQQLIKNVFFSNERSFSRKVAEALYAILLEMRLTKNEILELYLNEVFLGQEGMTAIHGFAEASLAFFDKEISKASTSEIAMLAGLVKAPSNYSPRRHFQLAQSRRNVTLAKMKELGFITEEEYKTALKEEIKIASSQRYIRQAPYFMDYIRKEIEVNFSKINPESRRIKIYTGIDADYQKCANDAVVNGLAKLENQYGSLKKVKTLQAVLLGVSVKDRQIRSWVGGRDYSKNQFERISMANRQPGSTFKPFAYLTALDQELNNYRVATANNILIDEPMSIRVPGGYWEPKNYDGTFRGEVTVREALAHSLNIPAIDLSQKIGIDAVVRTARLFGFEADLPPVPSLVLGAAEVTPLELTRAYLALANGGEFDQIVAYSSIVDDNVTTPLFVAQQNAKQVASPAAVFVLTDMLRSVIESGTGHAVRRDGFTAPAAGKTGTTNDARDAWFVGYTPTHLATVWVGLDDNNKLGLSGGQAAAPIWAEYMKCISSMESGEDFKVPPGVVFKNIDTETGLLWVSECHSSRLIREVFVAGTEPTAYCNDERYLKNKIQQHESSFDGDGSHVRVKPQRDRREEKSWWQKLWGL